MSIVRGGAIGFVFAAFLCLILLSGFGVKYSPIVTAGIFFSASLIGSLSDWNRFLWKKVKELRYNLHQSREKEVGFEGRITDLYTDNNNYQNQYLNAVGAIDEMGEFTRRLMTPRDWQMKVDQYLSDLAHVCLGYHNRVEHYEKSKFQVSGIGEAKDLLILYERVSASLLDAIRSFDAGYRFVAKQSKTFGYEMREKAWSAYAPSNPVTPELVVPESVPEESKASSPYAGLEPDDSWPTDSCASDVPGTL